MQTWQVILLIFSGLGIFNSLAFIVYLNTVRKQSVYNNIYLQIILLAFILQIAFALLELFQWNFSPYIPNMYLLGSYIQGPTMFVFIKNVLKENKPFTRQQFTFHFLPYILICLVKYDFNNNGIKEWIVIYLVGIQSLIYILLCIKPYISIRELYFQKNKQYYVITYLFPVFAILWINYPISGIIKINYQLFESILHSTFVYYLIFLKIKEPRFEKDKYKFSGIGKTESLDIYNTIIKTVNEKKFYLEADITLNALARKLSMQVNILSQVINQNSNLNFRDFINSFRIKEAEKQIISSVQKGHTIASVAFDCGFSSLSAFNRAFKKMNNCTPSDYIKNNL